MDPRVLVAGEALVDFVPARPGPLADVETFSRRAGGAPANVAVCLARLGEAPWLWTRVGADPFGSFIAERLASAGVHDRFVERDPDANTALAFVAHDASGDRSFTFYRDGTADTRIEPGAVPDEALAAVEWVCVGGVALSAEPSRTATLDLVDRAHSHGCTVVSDPNVRPELWADGDPSGATRDLLERSDVVTASADDLRAVGFEGDPAALAAAVTAAGPHTALVTLGDEGALGQATADAPWGPATATHRGYAVDAVDATGAGDAFTAGVVAALARGTDLAEAVADANAVAALTTTAPGATRAAPDRDAVDSFRAARE